MKFSYAVYKDEETEIQMHVDELLRHPDYLKIKMNLYCPGEECNAKLSIIRLSNGTDYFRRHRGYNHSETCGYLELDQVPVKSITEYVTENGRMTDDGINRRKQDAMRTLDNYLNPQIPIKEEIKPKNKPRKVREPGEETEINIGTKVVYDPNAEIIEKDTKNGDRKILETRFYSRMPHQISIKDSNKNLKTSAVLDQIIFSESNLYVEIKASFENISLKFILPEAFFNNSRTRLMPDELLNYLKIINEYIQKENKEIFITTMCQSQEIDLKDLTLWIFEPEFMSFQTRNGQKFATLTSLVIAIQTKSI